MRQGSTWLMVVALAVLLTALAQYTTAGKETDPAIEALARAGLRGEAIPLSDFAAGSEPKDFARRAGAAYKPSRNPDPAIPPQCWIETGYGTQNACLYCHTDYLASIGHGNALPLAEDQILYSFPQPELNHVLWRNVIAPEEIDARLAAEGVPLPDIDDTDYVRRDNWAPAFARGRASGGSGWMNAESPDDEFALFPALDPNHLFPHDEADPTSGGEHGYVDPQGFVRDTAGRHTGWRAVNFFPYGIFTPLTGSVSGIYIRLPRLFMTDGGSESIDTYMANLALLEGNIKGQTGVGPFYLGDASTVPVRKGFYPVGTEFAHPLHYVDLQADGEKGPAVKGAAREGAAREGAVREGAVREGAARGGVARDGVAGQGLGAGGPAAGYEFPGTRAKRLKEMRYMYKWRDVTLADIAPAEDADAEGPEGLGGSPEAVIGREGQGWVENGAGWILAAFIEDRRGDLRTQTTEELMQCVGCHGNVGNTIDAVWSFQRKLPGDLGWGEMDYGRYDARQPQRTRLRDYRRQGEEQGELEFFYHSVIGADLYGVMPREIAADVARHAREQGLPARLGLTHSLEDILDDEALKEAGAEERRSRLLERQAIMRDYAATRAYLYRDPGDGAHYVRGAILYPDRETMKANTHLYRKIVLDQSFNLGKDVFGAESGHIPFTFRSDGTVRDAEGRIIPAGAIITSRPYGEDGVGTTPTGIVAVNAAGEPIDRDGAPVDISEHPERAVGHVSSGGTFFTLYNPILGDVPVGRPGE